MNTKSSRSPWLRKALFYAIPVLMVSITAVLFNQSTAANQPIVQGVKPLPVMQQAKGQKLFAANCATCHGKIADGKAGLGPPLVHQYYEPNHHADAAFYRAAELGVRAHHWPFGDMPKQPQVSRDDMWEIIGFLRALQQLNGIH